MKRKAKQSISCTLVPETTMVIDPKPRRIKSKRPRKNGVKHRPETWARMFGLQIMDPDGWRGGGAPSFYKAIPFAEFRQRQMQSTCGGTGGILECARKMREYAEKHP